jgi:hypothetical protein
MRNCSRCEKITCSSKIECNAHGICVGDKQKYSCLCEAGYRGKRCEIPPKHGFLLKSNRKRSPLSWILPCSPADCSNRGLCIGSQKSGLCLCMLGFTGRSCENSVFDASKSYSILNQAKFSKSPKWWDSKSVSLLFSSRM